MPASCCNQEMTRRAVASVLLTGCVLAFIGGCGLVGAEERAHGQNGRLNNDLDEPVQHKVNYTRAAVLLGRHTGSSCMTEKPCRARDDAYAVLQHQGSLDWIYENQEAASA